MMISDLTWTKRRRLLGATVIGLVLIAGLTVLGQMGGTAQAAILTPITDSGTEVTMFDDDFSNETYTNESWTIASGTWAIENGELSQDDAVGGRQIHSGDSGWADYIYEGKLKLMTSTVGGLVFRIQDSNNLYLARVATKTLTLYKKVMGSWSQIAGISLNFNVGTFYTIKIELLGWNCRIFVNGDQKLPVSGWQDLTGHHFSNGKIGLIADGHVHFDDVKVNGSVSPNAYSLNVRAGVTEIVITCTWSGSGNITIGNLTSPTTTYYESDMSIYEKTTISVKGTTGIFNIRRAVLSITATISDETWTLHLNLNGVTTYQVSVETSSKMA